MEQHEIDALFQGLMRFVATQHGFNETQVQLNTRMVTTLERLEVSIARLEVTNARLELTLQAIRDILGRGNGR